MTTQCKRLAEESGGLYVSLYDALQLKLKSADAHDPHAAFAALYLEKGLETSPTGFMIDLLKEEIDKAIKGQKRCVILSDFPKSVQQLRGFEEKVRSAPFE
jgi:adenylate kinase family enzyme